MDSSNEKENVLSQIPTGRNNALVAESDVLAAAQAIQETFRAHERRWETEAAFAGKDSLKPSENQNQPPEDAMGSCTEKENDAILPNAELRAIHRAMLQDRAKRLVETVYRVSQVIPDDLYNNFVKDYCAEYDLSDGDTSDDDDDNDEADEETDNEEEEDEFSPHELVDHLAQQKVDELRRQVLDRARQIQLKRAAVIQRATRIAREATLRSVAPPAPSTNEAPSTSDRWGDMDPEKVKVQVASMRESMKELQQRLLTSEKKLETQLDQLKSTVAVIEKHQLQGGRNPTQKVDELMRTSFTAPHALQDDGTPLLDPAERLDEFLRR
jgi:hypothetical protein